MGTQTVTEGEFNVLQFEKQLTSLKDSQDSINTCCQWCLQKRTHHKKIVNAWLNVLKRVKVEQRLVLFYLANDVVQYSKRRNYEYVESWGTALQKATTMVRDEKVKHKILRIFKIWEQRGVYNEEFISDLCGLLSVVPSAPKGDEPHEFQPNYVINKIKTCSKLEMDTDAKLKVLKEHNPKIVIDDGLIGSLKDRAHLDDVEKEVDVYVKHMEDYINALKLEIKNRITLISVLKQAETQLEADRKDVKVVANAYKMFGTRVKTFQKKLDEHKATLSSPIPSPDINAPSPSPDSDIEFPEPEDERLTPPPKQDTTAEYNPTPDILFTNAGYYNPVPPPVTESSNNYLTNGFSSFIGSDMPFSLENLNSSLFSNSSSTQQVHEHIETSVTYSTTSVPVIQNPPLPVEAPTIPPVQAPSYSYSTGHLPLLPPPMPLFGKTEADYSSGSYNPSFTTNATSYSNNYTVSPTYETAPMSYDPMTETPTMQNYPDDAFEPPVGANPYPPSEEYNPEEDVSTWEPDASWNGIPDTDTPESPPMFEKEGYSDPIEYHDNLVASGAVDVDQRVIPGIGDLAEDSLSSLGGKDVDHRNLISLTGSPGNSNSNNPSGDNMWNQATDQDYRILPSAVTPTGDQDYRLTGFNIEQLKLPPPPPPPPKLPEANNSNLNVPPQTLEQPPQTPTKSHRKGEASNVESIDMDMDLSDDDVVHVNHKHNDNLKIIVDNSTEEEHQQFSLEPPPPLPDLPDDVDANNFLDDLSNDLHEFSNLSDELSNSNSTTLENNMWAQAPLAPPPMMSFNDMIGPQMTPMHHDMIGSQMTPINHDMIGPQMTPINHEIMGPQMTPINHPMNIPVNSNINHPINTPINPAMNLPMTPINSMPPPLNPMNPPPMPPMLLPPQPGNWMLEQKNECDWTEDDQNPWLNDVQEEDALNWIEQELEIGNPDWLPEVSRQNNWQSHQNTPNFSFRGRGSPRGGFNSFIRGPRERGRGRSNYNRGGNNFRGGRGAPRGNRGNFRPRGNFRGIFRGGF